MKRFTYFVAALFVFSSLSLQAHEGMWLPMLLQRNFAEMQKLGMKLTPQDIYSVNHSSIKDAVAGLSDSEMPTWFFCTSEIVSPKGLLFTNHHCGYEFIQKHSTVQHDYLKDGFWAMSMKEELPNPGLTASVLDRMADVTDSIIPFLNDTMTEAHRSQKVAEIISRIKKENSDHGKYDVVIKPFYDGNKYYMMIYTVYRDVRLVAAPPSSIGKFGGDTDNWMWPRQTGDFSVFRIYTAPDGSPAPYSKNNVPLKPKHFMPISLNGVEPGNFAMTLGFPGRTERYMTASELKFRMAYYYPTGIKVFSKKLDIWKTHMDASPAVRIKYASDYAELANSWKYFVGQQKGIIDNHVVAEKEAFDAEFQNWADATPALKAQYGNVLKDIADVYATEGQIMKPYIYVIYGGSSGSQLIGFAKDYSSLNGLLKQYDGEKNKQSKEHKLKQIQQMAQGISEKLNETYKDYDEPTDQDVFAAMTKLYYNNVPQDMHPAYLDKLVKKFRNNFSKVAAYVFNKSNFSTEAKAKAFLAHPELKKLDKDPAFILMKGYMQELMSISQKYNKSNQRVVKAKRLHMAGIMAMEPNKLFFPDANSTLRVSFGKVEGYNPRDAVRYLFQSHLAGVMEKNRNYPNNPDYFVPAKLKEIYKTKDYGQYGQDGKMDTDFLTTNDISGGNSGSPVINANGQLIGLAFDGDWQAMSGDIKYIPKVERTIVVDIRYVLMIIDKYGNDHRLIKELTLVKNQQPQEMQPKPMAQQQ
ncbi:MAG: S46 family peptidase [Bacteroidales bacterium]|nr:S46 family peptidase [Bacteroidales bacterium]